jgi:hypothetical protein
MEFFPRDSYRFARFQIFDSAGDFFIPSLLHRLIRTLKTVQQGIG